MKHFFLVFVLCLSISPSFGQEIEWVVEPKDNVGLYSGELAPFLKDRKFGLINRDGDIILEPIYRNILLTEFSYIIVSRFDGKFELIDLQGERLVPHVYDMIMSYNDRIVKVKLEDKWGFMKITGEMLSLIDYGSSISYYEGTISGYREENGNGYTNHKSFLEDSFGRSLTSLKLGSTGFWGDGLLPVKVESKYGFMNSKGVLVIPLEYDGANQFSEGLAAVRKDDKWGFINTQGEIVIPFKFNYAYKFNNGYCSAILTDKYGLIDKSGVAVTPFKYGYIEKPYKNVMPAMIEGKWGLVDFDGKVIIPFEHTFFFNQISDGLVTFQKGIYWGVYDISGKLLLPFEYTSVKFFNNGEVSVRMESKGGIIKFKNLTR